MKADVDEFFASDTNYIDGPDDESGMRHFRRKKRKGGGKREKSAKIAQYRCDADCGSNADIGCSVANLTLGNAAGCCQTSLRALAHDLAHLSSLHPGEDAPSKLKKVCVKNDRVFHLMVVTTILLAIFVLVRIATAKQ